MTDWTPGQRRKRRELETPYGGVPDHLHAPLMAWSSRFYLNQAGVASRIGIEFRLALSPRMGGDIYTRAELDSNFHLDLIEYLLETYCAESDEYEGDYESAEDLERLLNAGNSVYKVNEQLDGLELRTLAAIQAEVQSVVDTAYGSAGDHLSAAWNAAYSRSSDPVKSYSESIKAVEAALAPHVSPQSPRQTLGTMIRDISHKPSKWKFVLSDESGGGMETLLRMMRTLWEGQTSRHGGVGRTRNETLDEAQAAVHLAAALVQFGTSGALAPI